MALDASRLGASMKAAVDAIDVNNGEITNDAVLNALASAIVSEITGNAELVGAVTTPNTTTGTITTAGSSVI